MNYLGALVETAAARGLAPVVGSNGTLLSRSRAGELKTAGALGVGISLDSATARFHDRLRGREGAWEGAMRGIAAARAAGLAVLLQATLFEDNRHELHALAGLARTLGAVALNVFSWCAPGAASPRPTFPPTPTKKRSSRSCACSANIRT